MDVERGRRRRRAASSWAAAGTIPTTRSPTRSRSLRFDRSPTNGFRCVKYLEKDANDAALHRTIDRPFRDFKAEKPVDDATFALYLRQFAYDKTPLDAKIEEEKPMPYGVRQKVTFNAAYGNERMMAYVFLPPSGEAAVSGRRPVPRLRLDRHALLARRSSRAASISS